MTIYHKLFIVCCDARVKSPEIRCRLACRKSILVKRGYHLYMENNGKEKKEKTGWVAELISWVQVLVSAAVIAFVLTTFVIANSEIPTGSMENTIMAGSRVIGSRLHYKFADPRRCRDLRLWLAMPGMQRHHRRRQAGYLPGLRFRSRKTWSYDLLCKACDRYAG